MKYLLAAVLAAGCATLIPKRDDGRLAPLESWNEVTSPHFQLWIHGTVAQGEALLRDMEDLRRLIVGVAFQAYDAPGAVQVIALQDKDEVAEVIPRGFAALTLPHTIVLRTVIVVDANAVVADRRALTHELAHAVSANAFPVQPIWFAEGLATHFEALSLVGTKAEIGAPAPIIGNTIIRHRMIPLRVAFACEELGCRTPGFYAASWALFTYLLNENRPALGRYMAALAKLDLKDPAPTWDELVPELEIDELQAALDHWLAHGHIEVAHYDVEPRPTPLAHRALPVGEVHAGRALLQALFAHGDAGAAELAAALAADPTNVLANLLGIKQLTAAQGRAVAAAHPDDWRAQVLGHDVAKACAILAAHPDANMSSKLCHSATGAAR